MALQTRVLVSSISNLSDARYCAGMGVDLLGFNLAESSPDYMEPATYRAITEWVSGVQFVGELAEVESTHIQEIIENYPLDYLQVSPTADWAFLSQLSIPLICKVAIEADLDTQMFDQMYGPIRQHVAWFVVESRTEKLSTDLIDSLHQIAQKFPVLLGFGIEAGTVKNILSQMPIQGIVLKGSQEIKPGFKDYNQLADILEALEIED